MRVTSVGACRADNGCGYLGLKVSYAERESRLNGLRVLVRAIASHKVLVQALTYPLALPASRAALLGPDAPTTEEAWVACFPLFDVDVQLEVLSADFTPSCEGGASTQNPLLTVAFPVLGSKISSRLLTRRHPAVASTLRHSDDADWTGRTRVELREVWPSREARVLRVLATFAMGDGVSKPWARILTMQGEELEVPAIVMEDHVVPAARDQHLRERVVTFSLRLQMPPGDVVVACGLGQDQQSFGFLSVLASLSGRMESDFRAMVGGSAADPAYEHWLDVHRATWQDLELQRKRSKELYLRKMTSEDGFPTGERSTATSSSIPQTWLPSVQACLCFDVREAESAGNALRSLLAQSLFGLGILLVAPTEGLKKLHALMGNDLARLEVSPTNDAGCLRPTWVTTIACEGGAAARVQAAIAAAQADYLLFVDPRHLLEADAVWRFACSAVDANLPALLYCDEDRFADGHYGSPHFKTFPNLGKLRAHNYLDTTLMVRRSVITQFEWGDGLSDASWPALAYDLALRVMEKGLPVEQVSRLLVHECDVPSPDEATVSAERQALELHLARSGVKATVDPGPAPGTFHVRYALPDPAPLVSIVIPTKDHADLLRKCVESILKRTTYHNYEIVLVENNSVEPETFKLYEELRQRDARVRTITWKATGKAENGFNYSAIVNAGAKAARGSVLVFLNNDTQVIEGDWLEEMLGCLTRPEVSVVGAKLLFEDGLVQHAGMIANPNCDNAHINQNLDRDAWGYDFSAVLPSDLNMVTGACQMVRRSVFDELGGYDENLAVGFNDSEFCLRVRTAGYAVTFTPYALLYHREFSSRGRESYDERMRARLLGEKAYIVGKYPEFYSKGDFALNPNLDGFSLFHALKW